MIPPDANAAFVATMEDVLEVYQRPHDPQRPLVCLDETSKQLIIETRAPIPAKPGQPARHDYEYERNGVANLFMVFAPLEGWRHVKVTDRHTAIDYAHVLRDLSDTHFPDTAKIVLVQDNLNIHKPASLYEAFPAPEARRLVERFEWHYTPKHGSWLDLAESELGVLASQCLDRRIADKQILAHEVTAWQDHRNKHHAKADWQFTTANARVKLPFDFSAFEARGIRWVSVEIKSNRGTQRATQHGAPDGDGMRPAQDLGYRSRENGSDAAADRDPCQLFWINHGSHQPRAVSNCCDHGVCNNGTVSF